MGILDLFKSALSQNNNSSNHIQISDFSNNPDLTNEEIELLHKKRVSNININTLTLKEPHKEISLLPQEILFLIYIDKKDSSLSDLPKYWSFQYNLDFQPTLEKLYAYGYLKFSDSKYKLNNCTLKELKDICKTNNLKTSGKKQEIIDLICNSLKDEDIDKLYPNKYFQITDKGLFLVNNNPHISFFHSTRYLNIGLEYGHDYLSKHPALDMYSAALNIIDNRKNYSLSNKNWGSYRCEFLSSSVVYKSMKVYELEIKDLFIICILDLIGAANNNSYYKKEDRFLAPGILDFLNTAQKNLGCSDDEMRMFYENAYNEIELFHNKIKNKDAFFNKIIREKNKLI